MKLKFFIIIFLLSFIFPIYGKNTEYQFIQLDENSFSTKVWVLYSEKQQNIVILVGVIHIGEEAYYTQIQDILNSCNQVFYEGIQWDDTFDKMQSFHSELDGSLHFSGMDGGLSRVRELQMEYASALGLVYQNSVLQPSTHWVNADASFEEFSAMVNDYNERNLSLDKNSLDGDISEIKDIKTKKEKDQVKIMNQRRSLAEENTNSSLRINHDEKYKDTFELFVKKRNSLAMNKIIPALETKQSVAMLYGAAHMPDFLNRLEKNWGYKIIKHRWISAWSLK
ncbi:MAG: hypothetical protein JJT78_05185 [Leptospira sp.]|nr:hypothetical protein [Leptospira sp.]